MKTTLKKNAQANILILADYFPSLKICSVFDKHLEGTISKFKKLIFVQRIDSDD